MNETEVKYKVDSSLFGKYKEIFSHYDFTKHTEVNYLYSGNNLEKGQVLRVREQIDFEDRDKKSYLITVKGQATMLPDGYKTRKETEVLVDKNPRELFEDLGYILNLRYAKIRQEIKLPVLYFNDEHEAYTQDLLVCLDELPFGTYIELETSADRIPNLHFFRGLEVEPKSYPDLTIENGQLVDNIWEALF